MTIRGSWVQICKESMMNRLHFFVKMQNRNNRKNIYEYWLSQIDCILYHFFFISYLCFFSYLFCIAHFISNNKQKINSKAIQHISRSSFLQKMLGRVKKYLLSLWSQRFGLSARHADCWHTELRDGHDKKQITISRANGFFSDFIRVTRNVAGMLINNKN